MNELMHLTLLRGLAYLVSQRNSFMQEAAEARAEAEKNLALAADREEEARLRHAAIAEYAERFGMTEEMAEPYRARPR